MYTATNMQPDQRHLLPSEVYQSFLTRKAFATFRHVAVSLGWSYVAGYDQQRGEYRVISIEPPDGASVCMSVSGYTALRCIDSMRRQCSDVQGGGPWRELLRDTPAAPVGGPATTMRPAAQPTLTTAPRGRQAACRAR